MNPPLSDLQPPAGNSSGLETSSEPEFLLIGRINRPHGIQGEVLMLVLTDYPERLPALKTLYFGDRHRPHRLKAVRQHNKGRIMRFHEFSDRSHVENLRGEMVYIHIDDAVPLEADEYYIYQLEGMLVRSDDGQEIGTLTNILETGANDVYIITTPEDEEILLPAIPDVIQSVDISAKPMIVRIPAGLL